MNRGSRKCAEARAWLAAYAVEDLPPLERAWLDAHLSHCPDCASLLDELTRGFAAARAPLPEVDVEHLVTLVRAAAPGELDGPAVAAPSGRGRVRAVHFIAPAAVAVAAAFVLVVVVEAPGELAAVSAAGPAAAPVDLPSTAARTPPAPGPSYLRPTPYIRMVTAPGWVGRTVVSGARVDVEMTSGEAAFTLEGGGGRTLHVVTPRGVIDVIGTRFSVRVSERDVDVAVAEGKVAVLAAVPGAVPGAVQSGPGSTAARREQVAAGEVLTLDDGGTSRAPRLPPAILGDAFLTHTGPELDEVAAAPALVGAEGIAREARPQRPAARVRRAAGLDELLVRLEGAERRGRRGDRAAALAEYRRLEKDPRFAAHRDVIAYDRARLQGLVWGELAEAGRALARVERTAAGPLAVEAALTRCELGRGRDPCGAVACLDRLIDAGGAAADDARRLKVRWRAACEP